MNTPMGTQARPPARSPRPRTGLRSSWVAVLLAGLAAGSLAGALVGCGGIPDVRGGPPTGGTGPEAVLERARWLASTGDLPAARDALAAGLAAHPEARADLCPPWRTWVRRTGDWAAWRRIGPCQPAPAAPDPADVQTTWLARAATGDGAAAVAALQSELRTHPDDGERLATLAAVQWLAGDAAAAFALSARALQRLGSGQVPTAAPAAPTSSAPGPAVAGAEPSPAAAASAAPQRDAAAQTPAGRLALEVHARAAAAVAPQEAEAAFARARAADADSPITLAWAAFLMHHARVQEAEALVSAWRATRPADAEATALAEAIAALRAVAAPPETPSPESGGAEGQPSPTQPGPTQPGADPPGAGPARATPPRSDPFSATPATPDATARLAAPPVSP